MTTSTFSQRIIQARKDKNWTQLDLAQIVKVNVKNISRYELGQARPTIDAAADLAQALGVSLDYLAGMKKADAKKKVQKTEPNKPLINLLNKKLPKLSAEKKRATKAILDQVGLSSEWKNTTPKNQKAFLTEVLSNPSLKGGKLRLQASEPYLTIARIN